ncbi:MAG: hypothetical protein LBD75_01855 [Candidatus Peribacteria bacterium]|jgi:hypothetical protein|nr:hypothetical protein [Candidatus Peribacteria bacterium]
MDGQEIWGRPIKVDFAKEDPTKMYNKPEGEGYTASEGAADSEPSDAPVANEDETEVDENAF